MAAIDGTTRLIKALCLTACLAFAAAAVGSGLDRQSVLQPSLAAKIPALFASEALSVRGQAELMSGRLDQAMADGRTAVLRSPVDPVSTALLGAARLGRNDPIGARRAFLVAGRMGWRVPLTQAYWMQQAVAVGDYPVAAKRLDALLRQRPWLLGDTRLLAAIEGVPDGRKAIADRLISAPSWLTPYANEVSNIPLSVVTARALVLEDLSARGLKVGCDRAAPPVNMLISAGQFDSAATLWRGHCPEAGQGLLTDPDLTYLRISGARSYFEWDLVGNSDVGMVLVPGARSGSQQVELHSSAPFARVILRQLLPVKPGRYRLSWRASAADGTASAKVVAAIGCAPTPEQRTTAFNTPGTADWQAGVSLGDDCPAHWLVFSVLPGSGDLRLSGLRMDAAR